MRECALILRPIGSNNSRQDGLACSVGRAKRRRVMAVTVDAVLRIAGGITALFGGSRRCSGAVVCRDFNSTMAFELFSSARKSIGHRHADKQQ